jgi:GNAT superfamily N-acetyltransferase
VFDGVSELRLCADPYESATPQRLVAAVQQEYVDRYGGPDDSPVDPAQFRPPDGHFVVGYVDETPVAMGGVRRLGDGSVEIKRMYVVPAARGRGFARAVLSYLEERARELGAERVVLETGHKQPEAIALYESAGYVPIPGFGHYKCAPLAVSYAKQLRATPSS